MFHGVYIFTITGERLEKGHVGEFLEPSASSELCRQLSSLCSFLIFSVMRYSLPSSRPPCRDPKSNVFWTLSFFETEKNAATDTHCRRFLRVFAQYVSFNINVWV